MRIYTKTGDDGNTGVQGGLRISKSDPRIAAYGAVDEANALLGVVLAGDVDSDVRRVLDRVQNDLFVVGSDLSNPNLGDLRNRVMPEMVDDLESDIDRFESELPSLTSFVIPGGSAPATRLHHARTVVRRAEAVTVRLSDTAEINLQCMIYLNRLSDLLFVLARLLNRRNGYDDVIWSAGKKLTS